MPRRPGHLSRIHNAVKEIEPWGILIAVVALLLSLASFWIDYSDRVEERSVRAWQLLTTRAPGNSGKIAALQYLNREDGLLCFDALQGRLGWLHGHNISCLISLKAPTPLTGIDLSPPDPEDNGTPGNPLDDPAGAYLRYVELRGADLRSAVLHRADLAGADLTDANLSRADLREAQLDGANLTGANLTGANLIGAIDLAQEQLKEACGEPSTKLPEGLTVTNCPPGAGW
jgi:Pentapeptide repeats (8 copies)